jgi:hypothetical protein
VRTALWAGLLAIAAVWPSRLAGALDGAPLDTALDAALIGVALPFAVWLAPDIFKQAFCRALIVALLAWKAFTSAVLVQDGWCLRFESPVAIFVDDLRVPHAWDVRADWRTHPPRCSAIMTSGYASLNEFPAWFYNLPPDNFRNPSRVEEQPPHVTPKISLDGYLTAGADGVFQLRSGEGVAIVTTVNGQVVDAAAVKQGIPLSAGAHHVAIAGTLSGDRWSLEPRWNDGDLWRNASGTTAPLTGIDRWLRPWGRLITPLLVLLLFAAAVRRIAVRAGHPIVIAWTVLASVVLALLAVTGQSGAIRIAPVLLAAAMFLPLAKRTRNLWGAMLIVGVPFMTMLVALHAGEAGVFTWYPVGDDFWMFQRYSYRIFLQGYWLEGGQPTFWFQPLYRWIAGILHMMFGDSSIGELFWDGGCALVGAAFAFVATRAVAGFRWSLAAMTLVLAMLTMGPVWYLFGRGLSELTSMGFIYAAALLALRGNRGSWGHILGAGASAILGFFTRLNNLPMVVATAAFAWPRRHRAGEVWSVRTMMARVSWRTLMGIGGVIAIGCALFAARTWYYTGVFSLLHGTQGTARSVWQATEDGLSPLQNAIGSLLVVVTMSDPPRFDPRAVPIVIGLVASILGLLRRRPFDRLPMNVVLLCLSGFVGSLVARGSAYPGRFSTHVIPVTAALCVSAIFLILRGRSRSAPPR